VSCVLRVYGRHFDVEAYLRRSPFEPVKVYKRGARERPGSPTIRRRHSTSGCNILVSGRTRTDYGGQLRETIRFLKAAMPAIKRMRRFPGVDGAVLDFGSEMNPEAVFHYREFPEELVGLAARGGLALELSLYPDRLPASVTRKAKRAHAHAATRRTTRR
jgi:hypothetical protein